MRHIRFSSIFVPLFAVLLVACSGGELAGVSEKATPAEGTGSQNVLNIDLQLTIIPTSFYEDYCTALGYRSEERITPGECEFFQVCIFPDETECAILDFIAGKCGAEHSYCEQQGGQLMPSERIGVCTLAGGGACPELEFWLGECIGK